MQLLPPSLCQALVWVFLLSFAGCARTVYEHTFDDRVARYVLFPNGNCRYEEQMLGVDRDFFKSWASYTVEDTMLIVTYRDEERLPYDCVYADTIDVEIVPLCQQRQAGVIEIKVEDAESDVPILFCNLAALDKNGRYLSSVETNLEGVATIEQVDEIVAMQISYVGYRAATFNYVDTCGTDLRIGLMQVDKKGVTYFGNCMGQFIDFLVEYRIDNSSDISTMTANGAEFSRVE